MTRDLHPNVPLANSESDALVRPCTQVRSTILLSSIQTLREAGYGERYDARMPERARERLCAVGAPSWLPIDLAWTHYATCNALGLSVDEVLAIGAKVDPVHVSGVGLVLRAARAGGVTPWAVFDNAARYWQRMYDGGRLDVAREGPKDARLVVRGQPLVRFAYWRTGLRGIVLSLAQALSVRAYVHEEMGRQHDAGLPWVEFHVAWV